MGSLGEAQGTLRGRSGEAQGKLRGRLGMTQFAHAQLIAQQLHLANCFQDLKDLKGLKERQESCNPMRKST